MHRETTMKHGSHHMHDSMQTMWHHIDEHFHSSHFWVGVGVTLLFVGLAILLFNLAGNAPLQLRFLPYRPYF